MFVRLGGDGRLAEANRNGVHDELHARVIGNLDVGAQRADAHGRSVTELEDKRSKEAVEQRRERLVEVLVLHIPWCVCECKKSPT